MLVLVRSVWPKAVCWLCFSSLQQWLPVVVRQFPCPAPLYSYEPWLTVWLEDLSQHYQTFLTLTLPAGSIIVWSGLISGLVW